VELETGGEHFLYFIGRAPAARSCSRKKGNLVITRNRRWAKLLGKKQGDQPQLNFGGVKQAARIVSVE